MNILSISDGSERSTHAYLPYMAEAAGQEMLLCDLCIDGCSLEQHWDNWRKELPCYEYDICLPGETDTRTVDEVALHEAVECFFLGTIEANPFRVVDCCLLSVPEKENACFISR